MPRHIESASRAVAEAGLADRVELVEGIVDDLAYPPASFDLIWCRDVLEIVTDMRAALDSMARLLHPDGRLLLYTVFATDHLAPREAALLERGLGTVADNMAESNTESAFTSAGLDIVVKDVIGTEWREYDEERTQPASAALLRLARLRGQRERVVESWGLEVYETEEASLHWLPFLMLGKLRPVLYELRLR